MKKLSIVLATKNEEANIGPCLESVRKIADEIVIFDEFSTDKTREIAKKHGAKVYKHMHKTNFHETKQKAIEKATGDWMLQLDADERVTPELAKEVKSVLNDRHSEFISESISDNEKTKKRKLFMRHQMLIKEREGKLGSQTGEIAAYFLPRKNMFLGKPLIHAGVYPDGVIRLFKRGKARLPAKNVHELMEVDGEVGWLFNDLEHHESPTLRRYLARANRYTDLTAKQFKIKFKSKKKLSHFFYYSAIKPVSIFISLYFRHKGFLDGIHGFLWSFFSAMHFPIAYYKYWVSKRYNISPS